MKHNQIFVNQGYTHTLDGKLDVQVPDIINYGPKKDKRGDEIKGKGTGQKIQNQHNLETYWMWSRVRETGEMAITSQYLVPDKCYSVKIFGLSVILMLK